MVMEGFLTDPPPPPLSSELSIQTILSPRHRLKSSHFFFFFTHVPCLTTAKKPLSRPLDMPWSARDAPCHAIFSSFPRVPISQSWLTAMPAVRMTPRRPSPWQPCRPPAAPWPGPPRRCPPPGRRRWPGSGGRGAARPGDGRAWSGPPCTEEWEEKKNWIGCCIAARVAIWHASYSLLPKYSWGA